MAMEDNTFFDVIIQVLDQILHQKVLGMYAWFVYHNIVIFHGLFGLYISFLGLQLLRGVKPLNQDFIWQIVKTILIYSFILNYSDLFYAIYYLFTDAPGQLGAQFLQYLKGAPAREFNSIFAVFQEYSDGASELANKIKGNSVSGWISWVIIAVSSWVFLSYGFGVIIISKLALAVLLLTAPIFLPLLQWESTKGLAEGYLRQLLGIVFVPLFLMVTLTIMLMLLAMLPLFDELKNGSFLLNMQRAGAVTVLNFALFMVLLQVMSISQGIAGGMALSSMHAGGSLVRGARNSTFGAYHKIRRMRDHYVLRRIRKHQLNVARQLDKASDTINKKAA